MTLKNAFDSLATDGTDPTGVTQETGGTSIRGWLGSAVKTLRDIKTAVTGTLAVGDGGGSLSVDDGAGSLTVDGTVGIAGTVPVSRNGFAIGPYTATATGVMFSTFDVTTPNPAGFASLSVELSGTWVATVSFEASNDNINWVSIAAETPTSIGGLASTATSNGIYRISTRALYLRANVTAYTSGTITASVAVLATEVSLAARAGNITTLSNDVVSMLTPSQTSTANVVATGTSLGPIDVGSYGSVTLQTSGTFTATLQVQGSNDLTNWNALSGLPSVGQAATTGLTSITSATQRIFPTGGFRYARLQCTAFTSGTAVSTLVVNPPGMFVPVSVTNLSALASLGDTTTNPTALNSVAGFAIGYNGASWDRLRIPSVFKQAGVTGVGDSALWTPTSGKKFRVLRCMFLATANVATSGGAVVDVLLRDATTATTIKWSFFAPGTSVTTAVAGDHSPWMDFGNGVLSAAANNVLNVNLSAGLSAGKVVCVVAGTEE